MRRCIYYEKLASCAWRIPGNKSSKTEPLFFQSSCANYLCRGETRLGRDRSLEVQLKAGSVRFFEFALMAQKVYTTFLNYLGAMLPLPPSVHGPAPHGRYSGCLWSVFIFKTQNKTSYSMFKVATKGGGVSVPFNSQQHWSEACFAVLFGFWIDKPGEQSF